MKKLLLLIGLAVLPSIATAATHTAASRSRDDVQAAFDAATEDGAIVVIPAGTGGVGNWTSGATWFAPANATLMGAGTSAVGGGDQTVFQDDIASGTPLFQFYPAGAFRITGITFQSGSGATKDSGTIVLGGVGPARIDHCHFIPSSTANYKMLRIDAGMFGVLDSSILDFTGTNSIYAYNGRHNGVGNIHGDYEWSLPTELGSDKFFYIEDNIINGDGSTRIYDGFTASRVVVRFNTVHQAVLMEQHPTGHSGDDRGPRAWEVYGNSVTTGLAGAGANFTAVDISNGTGVVWGNSWNQVYKNLYLFKQTRRNTITYANPYYWWGYVGPTPRATGTVNVNGTAVTWVSGDTFDTGWPTAGPLMIHILGASAIAIDGQAANGGAQIADSAGLASINSSTSITLTNGGHLGSALTGATYIIGSPWDGNTNAYGYPAIDQPGRGQGDLLTGTFGVGGGKVNSTTGTPAWPNQALEPFYIWNNTGSVITGGSGGVLVNAAGENLVAENRDYYMPASGIQTSPTSPFDGTSGTGWGTLANRPTTCTPGVAYFAIDQGSWNTSTSNVHGVQMNGASGVLYKCTSPNTWTLYYTPYTYPHPGRSADTPTPSNGPRKTYSPRGRGALLQ
jgi:hypothetical protein